MATGRSLPERNIRLIGRNATVLEAITGQAGEVYYDSTNNSLRVYDGKTLGGNLLSRGVTLEEFQDLVGAMFNTAHSGVSVSYLDSIGRIQVNGFNGDYDALTNKPVLFSGNYNDLTNKPTFPTNISAFTNDAGYLTSVGTISYNDLIDKPTIPSQVNLTGYATESYVTTQINNLIGTAGTALDTLGELSAALNNDTSFATTVTNSLANKESKITAGTTAQYWRGDKTWQTLNATAVGLGNVTNESKGTMFTSPSFTGGTVTMFSSNVKMDNDYKLYWGTDTTTFINGTTLTSGSEQIVVSIAGTQKLSFTRGGTTFSGTVNGITASMVGLGNVTNESKATMFTNPSFTGTTTIQKAIEVSTPITGAGAGGAEIHNFSLSSIWYHSSINASFIVNFTNIPTTNDRTIVCTLILAQGSIAYLPYQVQIEGLLQVIKWLGGTQPTPTANKVEIVSFTLIRSLNTWTVLGSLSTYG